MTDATPYPLPRGIRETDVLNGNGGAVYGPFSFKIFDIEDVQAWLRPDGEQAFSLASVTVAKVSGLPFDHFTVTFSAAVAVADEFVVRSVRVPERAAGVKSGTRLDADALEKEFSKIAATEQELRRDILVPDPGLADGDTLMKLGERLVKGANAADIASAQANAAIATAAAAQALAVANALPAIGANRMLVDNAAGTAREALTFPEVRTKLQLYSVAEMDALLAAKANASAVVVPRRHLSGFEPEKLSGTVLRLQPGSAADLNASEVLSSGAIDIDMTTVGANGLDAGAPTNGAGYYPYLIKNTLTGALSAVLSTSTTYGGVVVPAGYTMFRKIPWGMIYKTATGWGVTTGIPDFHYSGGPKGYTQYTGVQISSPFQVLSAGTATSWTSIDLSGLVPDNARFVRIKGRVNYVSSAGTAYVRTYPTQTVGLPIGMANVAGLAQYGNEELRRYSGGEIFYEVAGGVSLDLAVVGYWQTEPS